VRTSNKNDTKKTLDEDRFQSRWGIKCGVSGKENRSLQYPRKKKLLQKRKNAAEKRNLGGVSESAIKSKIHLTVPPDKETQIKKIDKPKQVFPMRPGGGPNVGGTKEKWGGIKQRMTASTSS